MRVSKAECFDIAERFEKETGGSTTREWARFLEWVRVEKGDEFVRQLLALSSRPM